MDHSSALILVDRSYVLESSGKRRGIVVTWDYRAPVEQRYLWYRMSFKLDDAGKPFHSGSYVVHLELKESDVIHTYHGTWKIEIGVASPLSGQMKMPEGSWWDEREGAPRDAP